MNMELLQIYFHPASLKPALLLIFYTRKGRSTTTSDGYLKLPGYSLIKYIRIVFLHLNGLISLECLLLLGELYN